MTLKRELKERKINTPEQRIRFQLQVPMLLNKVKNDNNYINKAKNKVSSKSSNDADRWARTICMEDVKFQWVKIDNKVDIDDSK